MTKKELAFAIAQEMDLPQMQVKAIVQRVFDGIIGTLADKGRMELRNFGVFEVRKRKPRLGRNPKTGAKVKVPAQLTIKFKPGREMLEQVRSQKKGP